MIAPDESTQQAEPESHFPARPWAWVIPAVVLLLFLGALFWAKAQDPFSRSWFTLPTADHSSFDCVAVLPKPIRRLPVIFYVHGAGGSLMADGHDLRQMAELGLAVVSLDYDQTNEVEFAAQADALLRYLDRQPWADTNAIAWVGSSLGANWLLDLALQNNPRGPRAPRLLVQLSGAGLAEGEKFERWKSLPCPLLLLHGGQDEVFPAADTERLAAALQTNHQPVVLRLIPDAPHGWGPERAVVFRAVGEYCLTHLAGANAWQRYHSAAQWQAEAPPLWLFSLPAIIVAGLSAIRHRRAHRSGGPPATAGGTPGAPPGPGAIALRCLAGLLAAGALAETALHWATPRLPVTPRSLALARQILVQPRERADFDALAVRPVWHSAPLQTLLDHVQLAGYVRQLVNWPLNDNAYLAGVLSPVIDGHPGERLDWRRPLWEECYPRIRGEAAPESAARIIVRHLRERVTITCPPGLPREVPDIWLKQITDPAGFAILSVAALRSAGVPARLAAPARAEFWDGAAWRPVPAPALPGW